MTPPRDEEGESNRCGRAHREREAVNTAGAERSLEAWVLSLAPADVGAKVLDLGCGSGKLTLPYAAAVGPGGHVLGVDIAAGSVAQLQARAQAEGQTNVEGRVGDLDKITAELTGRRFDRIVSSYAIYYAANVVGLLCGLRDLLAEDGLLFVCGAGAGTNRELHELLSRVAPRKEDVPPPQEDFIPAGHTKSVAQAYAGVETHRLENAVRFPSSEALLNWWRNHNSHVASADSAVAQVVAEYFAAHREFRLTKNVLGVLFHA